VKKRVVTGTTIRWAGLLVLALLFAGCSPTGCIQGGIVDGNGYPVKGLKVTITNMDTHKQLVTHTDSYGNYLYTFPPLGSYTLSASRYGYEDLTLAFDYMGGTLELKQRVMANLSTVEVFTIQPPSLASMETVQPDIASRDVTVYLPPSYREISDRRYPVIYYLHGNGQNNWTFFREYSVVTMNLQSLMDELTGTGQIPEAIMIVPNGDLPLDWIESPWRGSFFTDSSVNGKFQTFVAEDLVDCMEHNADHCLWPDSDEGLRIISDGASRGIVGLCMGVIGALNVALRYPGQYAAVANNFGPVSLNEILFPFGEGVEPIVMQLIDNPQFEEFALERLKAVYPALDPEHYPDNKLPVELGTGEIVLTTDVDPTNPGGPEVELWSNFYLDNDPYTYLAAHPEAIEGLSFYLDCGDHDTLQLWDNNAAFSALLESLGLPASLEMTPENRHFFEIYPNLGHVDMEGQSRVIKALTFTANHLETEAF